VTLRRRLIAVQVALVALGLTLFAGVSYKLYSRIEYDQLNSQLHSASPLLFEFLGHTSPDGDADVPVAGGGGAGIGTGSDIPDNLPPGSYVEVRTAAGVVLTDDTRRVSCRGADSSCPTNPPVLPKMLVGGTNPNGRTFTDRSGQYRVLIRPAGRPGGPPATGSYQGDFLVTAIPLYGVTRSLHHLIVLDLGVGAVVLVALSAAGLLLLRRGLHPLERLATTARAIADGDLSQRAGYADRRTEVGQLGSAFNSMMGRIEQAFADRDATEGRLRQFLADASHELRTPLTSIRGYAELWQMGAATSGPELQTAMARIEEHARQMSSLVEELLLLARLDQTRPPERVPVDLTVLAAETLGDAAVTAPERRFSFDAPQQVQVVGDARHLRQAVSNLLVNAIRHTPAATPIELRLRRDGGVAVLEVRDHGPGLSDDGLQRAFDRFWRADTSRTGTGSGLGLAIVAAVAAEHGGRAGATNAADGGAVFSLRLPLPLATEGERETLDDEALDDEALDDEALDDEALDDEALEVPRTGNVR
jgi:two-component system OmpR family sensor kinase